MLRAFVFVCRDISMRFHFSRFLRHLALLTAVAVPGLATGPVAAGVEDVLKNVGQDGRANVLVRMKADGGGAVAWSPRLSVSRQRVAVATAFNEAAPALHRAQVGDLRHFRTIPFVAATVTRAQALALAAEDAVEGIYLIRRERHMAEAGVAASQALNLTGHQLDLDLGSAWERGLDGTGTSIAVIDSGINFAHPALVGKNIGDACFGAPYDDPSIVAQCPSGQQVEIGPGAASHCPADSTSCDHGTHVASVAAGNDGTAFGVARNAKIVPINAFYMVTNPAECSPDPAPCIGTDGYVTLKALDYVNEQATALSIVAVNLSFGGTLYEGYCDDDPRKAVIDMLRQKGVAVVAAAGNQHRTGQIAAPGCISSAVSVGATDNAGNVAAFSNFATTVDLMAPGVGVIGAKSSGGYGTREGTSMAVPQVAGAFAILRQAFPTLSVEALEAALKQTGVGVTRVNAGVSVPVIKIGAALDKLQGVNRRLFNNVVAVDNPQSQSMLRFYNPSDAVGNVRVTLRDAATGEQVGNWMSPPIPSHAALQFTAKSIQAAATISGFPMTPSARAYLNFEVESSFKGSAQHVLWNEYDEVFSNLTNCGAGMSAGNARHLMNVHSSAFAGYPSRIRIVNTGVAPAPAKLSLYNAASGVKVADWVSAPIASAGAMEIAVSALEAQLALPPDVLAGGNGYYNVTLEGFSGYLQHLVENVRPGALLDMTAKCDIAVSIAPPAPPQAP